MSDFPPIAPYEIDADGIGRAFYGSDKELNVKFERRSFPNGAHAIANGEPPFIAKDIVFIGRAAEMNLWRPAYEVTEEHKYRFPRQWAAFQAQQQQVPDGYPIGMLFPNEPERVETCRALHIHTIEQLAALSEQGIAKLGMGGRVLKERAEAYLEKASKRDLLIAQEQIAERQNAEIEALRAELAAMRAAMPKAKKEMAA